MATRETSGTNIDPGLIQRVVQGLRYAVTGVGPENWFGPMQPLQPQAQDRAEGRAFDYPVGYNLRIRPREGEAISFEMLRGLADGYDLLRLVIETRKDQIAALEWEIVPEDPKADAETMADQIKQVRDFLQRPNREHDWDQWLRQIVEELLVIDAVCVYPRMSRGGKLYALELVDGATIKRVLDVTGRTPLPPDPAYQQILKGIPAVDYTADDLIYTVRNPRVSRIYGYSPTEQVITTVNIALRRQMTQLNYYTSGNVPEAIGIMPETWTAKQIADFQAWWDSVMEGNLAAKRQVRFMPALKELHFTKEAVLKDEMDEWLARIVCFAFSISPSALIRQVNRASGEQIAEAAKEEGLAPLMRYISSLVTRLIREYIGAEGLAFRWKVVNKIDPAVQATVHKTYIDSEVITPDEAREDLGLDQLTPEERDKAWPTPIPPGMNPDGSPILPKGAKGAGGAGGDGGDGAAPPPGAPNPPAPASPTAAEKMLADALRMLDPAALAKQLIDHARATPPAVVQLRPEVNVDVGDTVVHVPVARREPTEPDLAKRLERPTEVHVHPTINVQPPNVTVEAAQHHINVQPAQIHPTINVAAPDVQLHAPITVQTPPIPPAAVEVHQEQAGPTEELIERDHRGDIVRVVRKPIT